MRTNRRVGWTTIIAWLAVVTVMLIGVGCASTPLSMANYGPRAAMHLNRNNSFSNQADILVNSAYDPETQDICSFETQVGHHGGLGGPQVQPFLMHPTDFPLDGAPLVGAPAVYEVLREWRDTLQGTSVLASGEYQAANPE